MSRQYAWSITALANGLEAVKGSCLSERTLWPKKRKLCQVLRKRHGKHRIDARVQRDSRVLRCKQAARSKDYYPTTCKYWKAEGGTSEPVQ